MRITLLAADVAQARPLQDALALRGAPCEVAVADQTRFDFSVRRRMDTVVNLIGDHHDPAVRLLLGDVLAWLGDIGASVVNGLDAFVVSSSPARQVALFEHLGLPHPPARVLASTATQAAAEAELRGNVDVLAGPPLVIREHQEGQTVTLDFVAGRLVASSAADLPDTLIAAAAEVLGTAGIEFGGVTLLSPHDSDTPLWLDVHARAGTSPAALGALAEHVSFRAGVVAGQ